MIIHIIATCGKGKSTVAQKLAKVLRDAGAKVTIKDEKMTRVNKRLLVEKFPITIKALRESGQKIVIKTFQANRNCKEFLKK